MVRHFEIVAGELFSLHSKNSANQLNGVMAPQSTREAVELVNTSQRDDSGIRTKIMLYGVPVRCESVDVEISFI
jgi:hypothetical protein